MSRFAKAIGIILVSALAIALFTGDGPDDGDGKASPIVASERSGLKPLMLGPKLELKSWRCEVRNGYILARGAVKNISNSSLKNVMIVADYKTGAGQTVKSTDAFIGHNPLLPGQISPFEARTTHNAEIEHCGVDFRHRLGGSIVFALAQTGETEQQALVREAQRLLNKHGYNAGPEDGIMGPITRRAIKEFQRANDTAADGKLDETLLYRLRNK